MGRSVRLFYSYSPHDEFLREELECHLAVLQRTGWIEGWHDRCIGAGDEMQREIDLHMEQADVILLLISSDFLASDYCWNVEVKRALERHQAGQACVVPVILRPVDWVGAPFGALKALPGDGRAVTAWPDRDAAWTAVAQSIRRMIETPKPGPVLSSPQHAPPPPSASYDPQWYMSRAEEQIALDHLSCPGRPVVLWGPEKFGKSWLLRHVLLRVCEGVPGSQGVLINLFRFSEEDLADLGAFARQLAGQLMSRLQLDDETTALGHVKEAFRRPGTPLNDLEWLLRYKILGRIPGRLFIAIDCADAIQDRPYRDAFYGLLRAWAEDGEPWTRIRLLLAVSTAPRRLANNPYLSPFTITEPIRLNDLPTTQVQRLAELYQLPWDKTDLFQLEALVGGHPYLVRVAMFGARQQPESMPQLLERVFVPHLAELRRRIRRHPGLFEALGQLMQRAAQPLDEELYHPLERMGILCWDGMTQRPRLRHALYQRLVTP